MNYRFLMLMAILWLSGCEPIPTDGQQTVTNGANGQTPQPTASRPLAYVTGQAVTGQDLMPPLLEASGGAVLSELVLDRSVAEALKDRGLSLTSEQLEAEKQRVLVTLSDNPDEAARLLNVMRSQRGLGEQRFEAMLRRNAGLRLLVKDDIEIVPALLRQAYDMQHGKRYRVRIIVAQTMNEASELLVRAKAGESFSDLASLHSTDPSAAQGGLLSPISPADPTYPAALRQALPKMKRMDISGLIATDDGFIIMRLDEIIPADDVSYEAALPGLAKQVRLELEAQQMQRTARAMLADAKVVVLDPSLGEAWRNWQQRTRGE